MPSWLKSSCLCFQSKETNVVIASKDMISELTDSNLQVASKEDMISELPDSILQDEILSRLPTKLAVSTSILSKRWRWLWTGVPALELSYIAGDESDHHKAAMFMNYVDNALLHHQFSKLRSFKLSYTHDCCTSRLPSWIFTVAHLNLHEIYLDIHIQDSNVIPMVFFHCQFLKVLSISAELLEALPHRDLMRILPTHANLTSLRIIRQCSGRNLLSFLRITPNIEELIFDEAYAFSEADLTSHIIEMLPKCLHSRIKKVQINEFNGCSSQFIKFLLTYVAGFEITDVIDAKTVSSSSVKIVTMRRHSLKPSHPLSLQDLFSHALGPPTYSSEDDE